MSDDLAILRPHTIPCPACRATLRYGFLSEDAGDLSIVHPHPPCRYFNEEGMTKFVESMIRHRLAENKP